MALIESVNVGARRSIRAKGGFSGIDKKPVTGPVGLSPPGPKGTGGSGVAGDAICDVAHHGGDAQAVYAFARESLDWWEGELGTPLRAGIFGENLTTRGLDVDGALIGETWRVGDRVVLQVTGPRVPCATFAVWMGRAGWLKRFVRRAEPGAYLRVLAAGDVQAGDSVAVDWRPDHGVTVGLTFRALTLEPDLLPTLLEASKFLEAEVADRIAQRAPFTIPGLHDGS